MLARPEERQVTMVISYTDRKVLNTLLKELEDLCGKLEAHTFKNNRDQARTYVHKFMSRAIAEYYSTLDSMQRHYSLVQPDPLNDDGVTILQLIAQYKPLQSQGYLQTDLKPLVDELTNNGASTVLKHWQTLLHKVRYWIERLGQDLPPPPDPEIFRCWGSGSLSDDERLCLWEQACQLGQTVNAIQRKYINALYPEETTNSNALLVHYALEVFEKALDFAEKCFSHVWNESFLDDVFRPFVELEEFLNRVKGLSPEYESWPKKPCVFSFLNKPSASAVHAGIEFADAIYKFALKAAKEAKLIDQNGNYVNLPANRAEKFPMNFQGEVIYIPGLMHIPSGQFSDWLTAIIKDLNRDKIANARKDRSLLIDSMNRELNAVPNNPASGNGNDEPAIAVAKSITTQGEREKVPVIFDNATRFQLADLADKIDSLYFKNLKAGEHILKRVAEFGQQMEAWGQGDDRLCPWPWKDKDRAAYYVAHPAEFLPAQYMLAVMIHDYSKTGQQIAGKWMLTDDRFKGLESCVPGVAIPLRRFFMWPHELPCFVVTRWHNEPLLPDLKILFGDITKDLKANKINKNEEPAKDTTKRVKMALLKMRHDNEPYTSQRKLAENLGCVASLVNKIIKTDTRLRGWMIRHQKKPRPKIQTMPTDALENLVAEQRQDQQTDNRVHRSRR